MVRLLQKKKCLKYLFFARQYTYIFSFFFQVGLIVLEKYIVGPFKSYFLYHILIPIEFYITLKKNKFGTYIQKKDSLFQVPSHPYYIKRI